ncbi:MAG: MFS transporter [Sphingomonadales bacterium]|nr:MFS transporter [Sphingomonadales bacterium]
MSRSQFALIAGGWLSAASTPLPRLLRVSFADRIGRVPVLTAGVAVWSLFTGLAGLSQGFWSLLAARPLVATGEATLVPTATNIILARTPDRLKAGAIGLFFGGIPLGVGGSFLIAGNLGPVIGWRNCFLMMAALGLVSTLLVSRITDNDHLAAANEAKPHAGAKLAGLWAMLKVNRRLRYATLAIVLFHAHAATGPFVQLWMHDDKGMTAGRAASLYGGLFIVVGLAGSLGTGALTDWLHRKYGIDRARSLLWLLLCLAPLILAYRLTPGGSWPFLAGMAASILFTTSVYGPMFSVIERELPPGLKATATGVNMLALNVVMIGGLSLLIGIVSEAPSRAGYGNSWTILMLGADTIALGSITFCGWHAARAN